MSKEGWYDFTRAGSELDDPADLVEIDLTGSGLVTGTGFISNRKTGDGAQLIYADRDMKRVIGWYIVFTDNQFGDKDPTVGWIKDPGASVRTLPELGATYLSTTVNATAVEIPNFFSQKLISASEGKGPGTDAPGFGDGDGLAAMALGDGVGAGVGAGVGPGVSNSSGAGVAEMNLAQAVASFAQGEGEGDGAGQAQARKGQGADGQGAGIGGEAALGEDQSPKSQRKRGLMLQPVIDQLASAANDAKSSSSLLKNLSEGTVMGNNLLDALALGAGVLYALYAPKAVETGKKGFRGLVNRVRNRGGANAVLPEQNLLSVFVMKLPNGTERLMAARVGMAGMEVIAQQDLPTDVRVDAPGSQTQLDFAMKQLISKLGSPNADLLLLGPKLKGQAALVQSLAKQTQLLNTQELSTSLSTCSTTDLEALQNWLNKPSSTPPESSPVYSQMMQRIAGYATGLPAEQANMAGLIELSVALAWSNRKAS